MKASETKLQKVLEGTNQYVIPLFQRAYSWERRDWDTLWNDIIDMVEAENDQRRPHFLGSMVTMQTNSAPEGVSKFLLIDGQQRYTTVLLLLAALRDAWKQNGGDKNAEEIHKRFLVNEFAEGDDHYKLQPTHADRQAFYHIVKWENGDFDEESRLTKAYHFFVRKLTQADLDFQLLKQIISVYLCVVSIVLDEGDDPHLVFESLNAKGRSLTQSDLIRNYFFMRIDADAHEILHQQYWLPMEEALGENLRDCVRHYLMKDNGFVKESDVYFTLKGIVDKGKATDKLKELAKFAGYYEKFLYPEKEKNAAVSAALKRMSRLHMTTHYPFLLNCYEDYATEAISAEDFVSILGLLENFVIRRFVCNLPTNQLLRIFPDLYKQAKKESDDLKEGVRLVLQNKGYPKDVDFKNNMKEIKLYGTGDRLSKTKFILNSIEEAFNHKEQIDLEDCTIEHIMPQTLTKWWEAHLGEQYEYVHEMFLHNAGNLTLTKYNTELSNGTFDDKKKIFAESRLGLNGYFSELKKWTMEEIQQRAEWVSDKALAVWAYFGDKNLIAIEPAKPDEYTIQTMANSDFLEDNADVYERIRRQVLALDADIIEEIQKQTIEFKLGRSIGSIVPLKSGLKVYINVPFAELDDPKKIARDVSNKGHWGSGDSEVRITAVGEVDYFMFLFKQSYNRAKKAYKGKA